MIWIKTYLVSPIETVVAALTIALVRTSVWFSIARHLTQVWVVARWQPREKLQWSFASDPDMGSTNLVYTYDHLCNDSVSFKFVLT